MEYIRIAVVTDDRAYGEAVCRSLLIGNRSFDLVLYESTEFCQKWREKGLPFREGFDLILWDGEDLHRVYGGNLVWLVERESLLVGQDEKVRESAGKPGEQRFTIYKYSPSTAMVAAIFQIYGELTGRRPAGARPDRVEVFAFVSWQGGCGCTTISMAVGQELVRFYRKRVLYLSLEGTESTSMYMNVPAGMKTAGEYLYRLDSKPFLEEYLVRDKCGVEAFAPTGSCNPLCAAEPGEIRRLFPALMDSGHFDVIIIDGGSGTGSLIREALSYADRICMVSSRQEQERESRYRAFLQYGIDEEAGNRRPAVSDRLIRVYNRCEKEAGEEGAGVRISERDSSASTLILEGSFGKDIHKLTELCYNGVATASEAS